MNSVFYILTTVKLILPTPTVGTLCNFHTKLRLCVTCSVHCTSTLQYVYLVLCTAPPHYSMCTLLCALHLHTIDQHSDHKMTNI
jgi:hypothetical protein